MSHERRREFLEKNSNNCETLICRMKNPFFCFCLCMHEKLVIHLVFNSSFISLVSSLLFANSHHSSTFCENHHHRKYLLSWQSKQREKHSKSVFSRQISTAAVNFNSFLFHPAILCLNLWLHECVCALGWKPRWFQGKREREMESIMVENGNLIINNL